MTSEMATLELAMELAMECCLLGIGCLTSFCLGRYYESRIWQDEEEGE